MHRHLFALEPLHAVRRPARDQHGRISRFHHTRLPIEGDATPTFHEGDVFVVMLDGIVIAIVALADRVRSGSPCANAMERTEVQTLRSHRSRR